jgi:hypothetical protein
LDFEHWNCMSALLLFLPFDSLFRLIDYLIVIFFWVECSRSSHTVVCSWNHQRRFPWTYLSFQRQGYVVTYNVAMVQDEKHCNLLKSI